jgi:hypothetical protein
MQRVFLKKEKEKENREKHPIKIIPDESKL